MNQQGEELLAAQLLETIEEAADYANVDSETIEQWIENGMLTTEDGSFIKINLDIYMQTDGNPSPEDKNGQISSKAELTGRNAGQGGDIDPKTGLPYEELEKMDISQIWDILKERQQ
jgi:excisionase family DNA binding protein